MTASMQLSACTRRIIHRGCLILVALAMVVSLKANDGAAALPGVDGALVIVGGGGIPQEVRQVFYELAGGQDGRLVVISTASRQADNADDRQFLAPWQSMGFESLIVLHTRDPEVANSIEFITPLREATAVWFAGGIQSRIAAAYRTTRVERELHRLLRRGGVVGGTSAGAAIQSQTMIAGGNPVPRMATGFDLLPGSIIDQHFLVRNREPRLRRAVADHPHLFGIGIDESTAVVVRGTQVEVLGDSSVTLMLAASEDRPELTVTLEAGELADLTEWQRMANCRVE